jgi:predicted amidohydrolase YtcJ
MPQNRIADLILANGVIFPAGGKHESAQAVAVCDGRIVYVGPATGAAAWRGAHTEWVELEGRMVLPGFHDGHIHAVGAATYGTFQIPLAGLVSRDDLLDGIRRYLDEHPNRRDYMGIGWSYATFPPSGPLREDLDALCPDKPVFLMSGDGHTAWVNAPALRLAGITRNSADPPGGTIVRHPVTNEPTGWLKEPAAFRLVLRHLSLPEREPMQHALLNFLQHLSAEGITSILQPGVELFPQEEMFAVLSTLDREGRLPLRIKAASTCTPQDGADSVAVIKEMKGQHRGRLFQVDTAKLFLDGVLESRTARLLDPYRDRPDHKTASIWNDEELKEIVVALDREGIQMHLHAIGDGAVRLALDSLEAARDINGRSGLRHTLAHLDLTHAADIPRFQQLGVIACFQPTWFHVGPVQRQEMVHCLGEERAASFYQMKSFLKAGAVVSCGSDYPAEASGFLSYRPLDGIEMGHTRRALGDTLGECYRPEERVSLADMIDSYTIRAAFQLHQENEVGSIEVGKLADLIVLNHNLFTMAPHEIHRARVVLTLLEGREVFRDPSFQ